MILSCPPAPSPPSRVVRSLCCAGQAPPALPRPRLRRPHLPRAPLPRVCPRLRRASLFAGCMKRARCGCGRGRGWGVLQACKGLLLPSLLVPPAVGRRPRSSPCLVSPFTPLQLAAASPRRPAPCWSLSSCCTRSSGGARTSTGAPVAAGFLQLQQGAAVHRTTPASLPNRHTPPPKPSPCSLFRTTGMVFEYDRPSRATDRWNEVRWLLLALALPACRVCLPDASACWHGGAQTSMAHKPPPPAPCLPPL